MTPLHLVIVVFFVLYSLETKESDAQSLVFVQQGNNALLDLTTSPGQYKFFFWKFNGDNNVVSLANGQNPDISNRYKEKAEFKQNYSLLLKNLQQTDSGDYVALASGDTDVQLAKYNVIVKDPVSPVKLTVTSNSSDPCNLTVTCSTVDSHITKTYRCDKLTCSYQGGANDDSINVTVREGVIICNHSNQVSWKTDRIEINSICVSHLGIPNEATTIGIVTGVLAAGLLLALCIYFKYPVSPVVLTVDSVSSSSDSCNLTVTCRTQDSHISSTFTCDTQTCSQEGGQRSKVTTTGASLHVYLVNDSITCNHSNQVSWTENQDRRKTRDSCSRHDENKKLPGYVIPTIIACVCVVLLILTVAFLVHRTKRRRTIIIQQSSSDTVYADPQEETALQPPGQTRDSNALSPTSTYCLVGQHTGPKEFTATRESKTTVESIYAQFVSFPDPVSPVKLTVTSYSSDPCNLTVTCSTVDSHITKTYRCDKLTCSYQGGANDDSINVTVQEGVIICNPSNQVSWKADRIEINSICVSHLGIPNEAATIGIVTGVLAAGLLLALCIYFKCKRPIEPKSNENTIYAVPEVWWLDIQYTNFLTRILDFFPGHRSSPNSHPADVSTVSPTSTYALVQFPSGHGKSNTINTPLPETVYAQVERPAKLKATQ
ncbi:hypothetical protein Q5P01_022843 [Channa striata]|uniref:Uncharacterized protein n=1 Tax=Channa striata TaxID=64152 RepID=A0AA88LRQ2_CHASR|nr:hypothetical protein Q5P01_022843 [Channa striata]